MHKKIYALTLLSTIVLSLIITNSVFSSDFKWTKIYGGNYREEPISVQQTSDGGYMIIGTIQAGDKFSVWFIKTDSFGDTLWTKKVGEGEFSWISQVKPVIDGGYIIVGSTSFENRRLALVIRIDKSLNILWKKFYGEEERNWLYEVQQTSDGGIIMGGRTNYSAWIIKIDGNGIVQWTKSYPSEYNAEVMFILETEDADYFVGANISEAISLIKVSASGDSLWRKVYSIYHVHRIRFLQQTLDGNYLTVGTAQWLQGYSDIWLFKTDINGITLWSKILHWESGDDALPKSIRTTIDSGLIILAGISGRYVFKGDWIIKTDTNGDTLWTKYIPSESWGTESLGKIETLSQTSDGGYILGGWKREFTGSSSDINYGRLIKTNNTGQILWDKRYDVNQFNNVTLCQQTPDGGFLLAGVTSKDKTNADILIIKTDASGNTEPPNTNISENAISSVSCNYYLSQNYPNPFNSSTEIKYTIPHNKSSCHVTLKIYDSRGRVVNILVNQNQAAGTYSLRWTGRDMNEQEVSSGIYFYTLQADKFKATNKMLLIH
jgi:hypothetical protein